MHTVLSTPCSPVMQILSFMHVFVITVLLFLFLLEGLIQSQAQEIDLPAFCLLEHVFVKLFFVFCCFFF